MKKILSLIIMFLVVAVVGVRYTFAADEKMLILRSTNSTCNIYAKPDGKQVLTYISPNSGRDVPVISKSGQWYKIMISGVEGWIKNNSACFGGDSREKKISEVSKRNMSNAGVSLSGLNVTRYQVVGNKMYLNIIYGSGYSPLEIGYSEVPSGLKNKTVYYSYDGNYFYTNYNTMVGDYRAKHRKNAVNKNKPFYNYYQYLPMRSTSKISGATFDKRLTQVRTDASKIIKDTRTFYPGCKGKGEVSTYNNYSSAVYKKGNAFASKQSSYQVNAGVLYGIMLNESAYGTSPYSRHYNNPFGWGAVDSCPDSATKYKSMDDAIAKYYKNMSEGYANPINFKGGNGTHLGNKQSGANVKYASDPYWGYKNAFNYRKLDELAGNVDKKRYKLGVLNSGKKAVDGVIANEYIKVYASASTSAKSPYYYERNGATVIIQGESGSFYKVQKESSPNSGSVYIPKSAVSIIANGSTASVNPETANVHYEKSGSNHYIYGKNNLGQMGNGNTTAVTKAKKINLASVLPKGETVKKVVYNNNNIFILTNKGNLFSSGSNAYGQRSYTSKAKKFSKMNPVKINNFALNNNRIMMQRSDDHSKYYYVGKNGFNYNTNKFNRTTKYPVLIFKNKKGDITQARTYNYSLNKLQGKYYYNSKKKLTNSTTYKYDKQKRVTKNTYSKYSNGKITYRKIVNSKSGKNTMKWEYYYNNGKLKSTNKKKAYRIGTYYNKKGKATDSWKRYYNTKGKLGDSFRIAKRA